ncbi:MAG: hypothetical protein ACK55I_14615, partial [bacterium]
EVLIERGERRHLVRHLLARDRHQPDRRQVVALPAVGRVVHLEDELRPGRDAAGVARRERGGPLSGHVGAQEPEAAEVSQTLRPGEDDGVVDHRRRPRDDLRRSHPGLLLDVRIGDEVLVIDRPRRRHAVGAPAQRGDDVGG